MTYPRHWPALLAVLVVALGGIPLSAAETVKKAEAVPDSIPAPPPKQVAKLVADPAQLRLRGSDSAQQLVITAHLGSKDLADVTGNVDYDVADSKIVRVLSTGRVLPVATGTTEIVARYGSHEVRIPVHTEAIEQDLAINFGNQIVPIFSKLGCNSGGCHGKASGQNGFKLSLLGFDAEFDYISLVKEARGRRVFPASPDNSLLLLKATGKAAHGGGKRVEPESDEYKLIRRWIASGLPYGKPDDPVVTRISIVPEHRILPRGGQQQIAVRAHYSDGSVEDITRRAQYESNDTEVATVDESGLVRALEMSGEAAVMARYLGQVAVFRGTVPLGVSIPSYTFEPKTVVDVHTRTKWAQLGIVPAEECTDAEFLRRASLDIIGTLPTPAQIKAFTASNDPDKRAKLVDTLLETEEYGYYFANKWADILRVKRGNQANRAFGTFVFHNWIREAMAKDMPYDEFAREILTAIGDESENPPTVWYSEVRSADQFVDNLSQVFLGTRLQCAQCHHHPYEKWGQDDYWGLAAFYSRVGIKNIPVPSTVGNNQRAQRTVLYIRPSGNVINQRTKQPAEIKPLDGKVTEQIEPDEDPRQQLVDWMVDPKNPFFARAIANRYWAHFFGRGIVDPLDDMRVTNPPSNPELLDALAKELVDHKYSLKHLIRTICKSRTYSLSSAPNEFNKHDRQANSRYYPKRMSAEVLFDAVCEVTNSPTQFNGLPQDRYGPRRAIMLPDESFPSYFLDVFGRPQRISPCECERVSEANLAQALHLLNSDEVQGKLSRGGGRANQLAQDPRPDREKVEELFLWALARKPSDKQLELALSNIELNARNKQIAYENILWALINTKEFLFIR